MKGDVILTATFAIQEGCDGTLGISQSDFNCLPATKGHQFSI